MVPYFKRAVAKGDPLCATWWPSRSPGVASPGRALRLLGERVGPSRAGPAAAAELRAGKPDAWRGRPAGRIDPRDPGKGVAGRVLTPTPRMEPGGRPGGRGHRCLRDRAVRRRSLARPSPGLDVRHARRISHLELLAGRLVGGAVLTGCVDTLPVGAQWGWPTCWPPSWPSAAMAGHRTTPAAWHGPPRPVAVDLSPRPSAARRDVTGAANARHDRHAGARTVRPTTELEAVPGEDADNPRLSTPTSPASTVCCSDRRVVRHHRQPPAVARLVAVHQFIPSFTAGSAMGTHALEATALRDMGIDTHTWVGEARGVPGSSCRALPAFRSISDPKLFLLYQLSTGSLMADFVPSGPGRSSATTT